ncbi:MAG: MFS transporter [Chitinophagales bacterium]
MRLKPDFFKDNFHLLLFGFLFTFLSGFGQTFFISLFVPKLQAVFSLSDAEFSSLYALATLSSAFTLSWAGRFIDKLKLPIFSSRVMIGFVLSLLVFSQSYYVPVLFFALYGVRLFGQGMMSHTAMTSMVRFFEKNRGKAVSFAALGHPAGEAIFPIIIVSLMALFGWRISLICAAVVVAVAIPLSLYLLMRGKRFSKLKLFVASVQSKEDLKEAAILKILGKKSFWILAPSSFASGSIGTAFLFFQLKLGEVKGWDATFIAATFSSYAFGNAMSTIAAGWLADRFSGRVLFPFYLLPFGIGLICLFFFDAKWVYLALISGIGISNGFGNTVKNAAMAEMFGVKVIGSVRSLFTTAMVFSTAVGPVVFGVLLDFDISFEKIALGSFFFFALVSLNALRGVGLERSI